MKSLNTAACEARGEHIFLLNDDVRIERGAFAALIETMDTHPEAGAVGCKMLYPNGELQERLVRSCGWTGPHSKSAGLYARATLASQLRRADYCSGAALLVRRSVWADVGGMDEGLYWPTTRRDVNLSLKIATTGEKVVLYEPRAVVRHIVGSGLKPFGTVTSW